MAYQLIYTSAPRLLEAGRSGFGTVARHRGIHDLLVSTLERDSQFDRNAGSIIFAHRVLPIAGKKFHILSSIRDAGSDYTGRTNHIAHHLIFDEVEISALSSAFPTPADVLQQMTWQSSWSDTPRWFGETDEISLNSFIPGSTSAWEAATGESRRAGLLEPSKDICLIVPSGADTLGLFSESLRRTPAQSWQVPLTTALQSGDDPTDFRWIAAAPNSASRPTAENNRTVLDLTEPSKLPIPAIPLPSAVALPSAVTSVAGLPHASFETQLSPTASASSGNLFADKLAAATAPSPSRRKRHTSTRNRTGWWIGVAGLVGAVVLAVVFVLLPMIEKAKYRSKIKDKMIAVFGKEMVDMEAFLKGNQHKLQKAHTLVKAAQEMDNELTSPNLTENCQKRFKTAMVAARKESLKIPQKMSQLAAFHGEYIGYEVSFEKISNRGDVEALRTKIDSDRGSKLDGPTKSAISYHEAFLSRLTEKKNNFPLPQNAEIQKIAHNTHQEEDIENDTSSKITQNMDDTSKVDNGSSTYKGKLILLSDRQSWKEFSSELQSDTELWLKKDSDTKLKKLKKFPNSYRLDAQSTEELFNIEEGNSLREASQMTQQTYELAIQLKGETRAIGWKVTTENPLKKLKEGISRENAVFSISSDAMDTLTLAYSAHWNPQLELPFSFPGENDNIKINLDASGKASLKTLHSQLQTKIEEHAIMFNRGPDNNEKHDDLKNAKNEINKLIRENSSEAKRLNLPEITNPSYEFLGNCMMFIGQLEKRKDLGNDLFDEGKTLLPSQNQNLTETPFEEGLRTSLNVINEVIRTLEEPDKSSNVDTKNKKDEIRKASLERVKKLKTLFEEVSKDQNTQENAAKVKALAEANIAQLKNSPILDQSLPKGEYRLLVTPPKSSETYTLVLFNIE